jgi:four helix bundle protein
MGDFKDLIVYQKAFSLSMFIYTMTKQFPKDELYSLTSQIVRSSRSVCANIGEGYRKRRYEAHFIAKLSDADMENTETQVWLEFALACKYLQKEDYEKAMALSAQVGKLLQYMMRHPEKYSVKITANRQLPTAN